MSNRRLRIYRWIIWLADKCGWLHDFPDEQYEALQRFLHADPTSRADGKE
jgi:hypothetical protein